MSFKGNQSRTRAPLPVKIPNGPTRMLQFIRPSRWCSFVEIFIGNFVELNSLKTTKSTACPTSAGDARHPSSIPISNPSKFCFNCLNRYIWSFTLFSLRCSLGHGTRSAITEIECLFRSARPSSQNRQPHPRCFGASSARTATARERRIGP